MDRALRARWQIMAAKPRKNKTSRGGAHDPPRSIWRCPDCRRQFANRNQSHACGRHTLASHFAGKPAAMRAIFDRVRRVAERSGPIIVLPEKTRIAFQVRMSFAAFVIRRNWVMGTSYWRAAWRTLAFAASKRSHREIISTPFDSRASRRSMTKSQSGSPKPIEWANSGTLGKSNRGL